jgi:hypothetical protein
VSFLIFLKQNLENKEVPPMKKLAIICTLGLIAILVFISLVGCEQEPAPALPEPAPSAPTPTPAPVPTPEPEPQPLPPPAPETLTYINSEYGFSVEYPKDWDFEEGLMGVIVVLAGPFLEEEQFMININITSEELPKFPKMSLEDYSRVSEMQIKKMAENYEEVDRYDTTIADCPAIMCTFTSDYEGIAMMQTQIYFLEENVAYVITYSATPQSHDQYYECFEGVVSSFKFE